MLKSATVHKRRTPKINRAGFGPRFVKCNSFFSGIGGLDLGLEQAGIIPGYQCEIDKFCHKVLARHWPQVEKAKDINAVTGGALPDADVWCGGFPCQDVSVARGWLGREGLNGRNSSLFYPFAELVKARLPTVVLIENVEGLLNSHNGADFAIILDMLSSLGYGIAWRVLNSRYFGVPQSRRRLYICAWAHRPDLATKALFEKQVPQKQENERKGFLAPSSKADCTAIVPEVAYCLAATSGRHTGTDWSRSYVSYVSKVRRLTPLECERLQGFPDYWTLPDEVPSESDEHLDSLRYKALGNAVSVPVIHWIAERIVDGFLANRNVTIHESETDEEVERILAGFLPELDPVRLTKGILKRNDGSFTDAPHKWQTGGVFHGGVWIGCTVPPMPCKPVSSKFIDVIEEGEVGRRYYLSPNAATGILRRVESQGRRLFLPLEAALSRLKDQDCVESK